MYMYCSCCSMVACSRYLSSSPSRCSCRNRCCITKFKFVVVVCVAAFAVARNPLLLLSLLYSLQLALLPLALLLSSLSLLWRLLLRLYCCYNIAIAGVIATVVVFAIIVHVISYVAAVTRCWYYYPLAYRGVLNRGRVYRAKWVER